MYSWFNHWYSNICIDLFRPIEMSDFTAVRFVLFVSWPSCDVSWMLAWVRVIWLSSERLSRSVSVFILASNIRLADGCRLAGASWLLDWWGERVPDSFRPRLVRGDGVYVFVFSLIRSKHCCLSWSINSISHFWDCVVSFEVLGSLTLKMTLTRWGSLYVKQLTCVESSDGLTSWEAMEDYAFRGGEFWHDWDCLCSTIFPWTSGGEVGSVKEKVWESERSDSSCSSVVTSTGWSEMLLDKSNL